MSNESKYTWDGVCVLCGDKKLTPLDVVDALNNNARLLDMERENSYVQGKYREKERMRSVLGLD